jgi:hypothetical protein
LRRLREASFIWGDPPDTPERCRHATRNLPGLGEGLARKATASTTTRTRFDADFEETRNPNEFVRALTGERMGIGNAKKARHGRQRYAIPTLLFRGAGGEHTVPGWMPYQAYEDAMNAAVPGSTRDPRPDPTPDDAFAEWPSLTAAELTFLCRDTLGNVPNGVVLHRWPGGTIYYTAAEAAALGVPRGR